MFLDFCYLKKSIATIQTLTKNVYHDSVWVPQLKQCIVRVHKMKKKYPAFIQLHKVESEKSLKLYLKM